MLKNDGFAVLTPATAGDCSGKDEGEAIGAAAAAGGRHTRSVRGGPANHVVLAAGWLLTLGWVRCFGTAR